jgi:hypothetical protein
MRYLNKSQSIFLLLKLDLRLALTFHLVSPSFVILSVFLLTDYNVQWEEQLSTQFARKVLFLMVKIWQNDTVQQVQHIVRTTSINHTPSTMPFNTIKMILSPLRSYVFCAMNAFMNFDLTQCIYARFVYKKMLMLYLN